MKISINWIKDFVNLDGVDIDSLIDRLTISTAEVEKTYRFGDNVKGVITAKIASVENHPSSKKLHLLKVDTGRELLDIVCGAPNVETGMIVPLAVIGSVVGEMNIEKAQIGGFDSHGMCCSGKELGFTDDNSGLFAFESDTPIGVDVKTILPIDDIIFEIDNKSLTNRPDLWCHYGFAREIAALSGRMLTDIKTDGLSMYNALPELGINISDKEKCFRYSGIAVENINVKKSPVYMQIRLYYCGMRAINLLADLTNYVMLEFGQPMHAFDYKKVNAVNVRTFDKPFEFTTLDASVRTVDTETLMICDGNDIPVCIAGIMGGLDSEITDATDSVLLESASFNGITTRKSSSKLTLRTEASMRYEKMLDPELSVVCADRFLSLLTQIDPSVKVISKFTDRYPTHFPKIKLEIKHDYIEKYIGASISVETVTEILTSLGFGVLQADNTYSVDVPSWRSTKDVTLKVDLVEEITRIFGYNNIQPKSTMDYLAPVCQITEYEDEYSVKKIFAEKYNFNEIHSYIWNDKSAYKELGIETAEGIKVVNAISPDTSSVRSDMTPTMLVKLYENRNFSDSLRLFEVGHVADGITDGKINEVKRLSFVLSDKSVSEEVLFESAREILASAVWMLKKAVPSYYGIDACKNYQHPVNLFGVSVDGKNAGYLSVLHPQIKDNIDKKMSVVIAEIDFNVIADVTPAYVKYSEISKFPAVDFDLSLVAKKDAGYGDLKTVIDSFENELLTGYSLVDVYESNESKSYSIRFNIVSYDHTLTSNEITHFREDILKRLADNGIVMKS